MRPLAWDSDLRFEIERLERFVERFEELWEAPAMAAGYYRAARLIVSEANEAMVVTADLPGVNAEDLALTLAGDVLTLKGEDGKDTFLRTVRLPMPVDASGVTATYKTGVLVVTLPKTPAVPATTIPVKTE
jgi:HSP20 family protein